jgi:mono/diheme cytochrome c family protein
MTGGGPRGAFIASLVLAALLAVGCGRQEVASVPGLPASVRGNPGRGEALFGQKGCIGCHTVSGIGGQVGPNLTMVARRDLARERPGRTWPDVVTYIRESILEPQAYIVPGFPNPSPMPSARLFELSDQDIDDLIAYLFSAAARAEGK